jgi:hypothetical protein
VGWIRSKGVNVSEQPNSGVVIGSHFGPMTRTRGRSREFMNCNMKDHAGHMLMRGALNGWDLFCCIPLIWNENILNCFTLQFDKASINEI